MNTLRVLIAGGGIGGLSAALLLARHGASVTVLEQAETLNDLGAGIQLAPNATRVLFSLGLEAPLRVIAFEPVAGETRHWRSGRVLGGFPLGKQIEARYGFPYLQVHRADLIGVLARAVSQESAITIQTGTRLINFESREDGVRVHCDSGAEHLGDLLIGADGIHSLVREGLFGPEAPRFTGNIAWRALVPRAQLPPGLVPPKASVWWGPGRHFVHYYVRGGDLVNCVCVVEKGGWEVESWSERGDLAELKSEFAGWHGDIQTLLESMDPQSLYKWALFDRPPMPEWSRGRVSLLGDACHATLPFMAQGAAMAIEDGAVLFRCLQDVREPGDIPGALRGYAGLRRARTARVQRSSLRAGRIYHMRGVSALVRNLALSLMPGRQPWTGIYSYNALLQSERSDQ